MNEQGNLSAIERLLGLNWRTTVGGALAAGGGILAGQAEGDLKLAGQVVSAIGLAWMGLAGRDRAVSGDQMARSKK